MTLQFVETIKIKDGKLLRLPYHQMRMERTIRHFFPSMDVASIPSLQQLISPTGTRGVVKARVVYGQDGTENVEYAPYTMREMHSLQVVEDNNIDYSYKSCDRSLLNRLVAKKGNCDDVIIIRRGRVTDTSFTNLALYDGHEWLTPRFPLLLGTQRAHLLDQGTIREADITMDDLHKAEKVCLFNAMIEFGERVIDIQDVHF